MNLYRAWTPLLVPVLCLASAACGGGGGGGTESGSGAAPGIDVLVGDAPSQDLLAFRATVTEVSLVEAGGGTTGDLLSGELAVEFLGLDKSLLWLATGDVAPGTYTGARLSFAPGSYQAVAQDGSPVGVLASSDVLALAFAVPYVHGGSSYRSISLDLNLVQSLSGSVASPPLLFTPTGSASLSSGGGQLAIDEIKGVVQTVDAGSASFLIEAFVDDDLIVPLGPVSVQLGSSALLLDDDGSPFASSSAFFAALQPGLTLVEVHGALSAGAVVANKVEIEDHVGGVSSQYLVKIEGRIVGLDSDSFTLMIQEIEKGASVALPVLASYGNPSSIEVAYSPGTPVFLGSSTPTTVAALAVGLEVKVKFAQFTAPPFPAAKIELEDSEPEFEGFVTDVSGLPISFTMHVQSSQPAVMSGQIASGSTDVAVVVAGAPVFLDTDGKPTLQASDLLVGMKVEPQGLLTGPPSGPTVQASKVKVYAGRLEGLVSTASPASSSFVTGSVSIDDPFGSSVTSGPIEVLIAPGCVFEDEAGSKSAFFALFAGLGSGEVLEVRVEGIGTGAPGQVMAYVLRAKVEND